MSKRVQWIIIIVCIAIAIGSIGYLAYYYVTIMNKEAIYDEIVEEVYVEPEVTEVVTEETTEETEEVVELDIPIDFDELHEINEDIYAWIEIEGTQIAYPIVQSSVSNEYYLNLTVDGVSGLPGSIYSEYWNGQDFDVFNTILYGHNMNNDSMFGGLNLYRDLDYMIEHETLMIYTEDAILEYQVYAAAYFDSSHLAYTYSFDSDEGRQQFLDDTVDAKDLSKVIRDDVEVTTEDKIITMSTCVANQSDKRLLVEAVLVNEQRQ